MTPPLLTVDLLAASPAGDDAATTTAPTPQDPSGGGLGTDSTAITAGLGGFLVVFALALALWVLGRDLTRRLRRMGHAEQERAARETDEQERTGGTSGEQRRDPLA